MGTIHLGKKASLSSKLIFLFFLSFLLLGLWLFRDYGYSWDEKAQREIGWLVWQYIRGQSPAMLDNLHRLYGPVIELLLYGLERLARLTDTRQIYLSRHLLNFIIFYLGTFFFFLLTKYRFKSWKIGLLGSLFLILSPRIFADSFYNSKDIPFLSLAIISLYTLVKFLDKLNFSWAVLHALATALLIDIRVLGVVMPVITLAFFHLEVLCRQDLHSDLKRVASVVMGYLAATTALVILFWPYLWTSPLKHFWEALQLMTVFKAWINTVLYEGRYILSTQLPWHYLPRWIGMTTPLLYSVLFTIGVASFITSFCREKFTWSNRRDLIFLGWFLAPIVGVIFFHSIVYDAWRQFFFIYPGLLLIALRGTKSISDRLRFSSKVLYFSLILLFLAWTAFVMVRMHPYQNVYFNASVGGVWRARGQYELDYWGLSFADSLKFLARHDASAQIRVCPSGTGGEWAALILPKKDQERFVFSPVPEKADYFFSNYRWHEEIPPNIFRWSGQDRRYKKILYEVVVDGARIGVVYQL